MLRHGSQPWELWLFGAVAVTLGLALWHGLGPGFGFGSAGGDVSRTSTIVSVTVCAALVVTGLIIDGR
jgi:hypothetical protein